MAKNKIAVDMRSAIPIHLNEPGGGEIIGSIVHDEGPKGGEFPRPFKEFPYHAVLEGRGVVASSESYGDALRELFTAWVKKRMEMEERR